MARIYRKTSNDINCLPTGWQTQLELLSLLLDNQEIYKKWSNLNPGMMMPDTVDGIERLFFMKNSWQLTSFGAVALVHTNKSWVLEHQDNALINGRVLLNMSKIINSPWYNRGRHVYVWDEGVHFEMQMFDGSIKSFVDFYLPK
jgi:hypothetical protein